MTIQLTMPALSPTMETGALAKWLVGVGDRVRVGDVLAEIETDKATIEYEAPDEGVISEIVILQGTEDVAVGSILAILDTRAIVINKDADRIADLLSPIQEAEAEGKTSSAITISSVQDAADFTVNGTQGREASPLAARLIAAMGLDRNGIVGSGVGGRIVKDDILIPAPSPRSIAPTEQETTLTPAPEEPVFSDVPHERVRLTSMQRTIARRLTQAKQSIPHFYLSVRARIGALLELREELNGKLLPRNLRISVNDMMIKTLALALRDCPNANVQFDGDALLRFERSDISVAVAVDGGLLTPVIRNASLKPLSVISAEAKSLADRARTGALLPQDYQGGTASLSNLGMFGIDQVIPVINPPQALIVGIGSAMPSHVLTDGTISVESIVSVTGSFDHRAINGADAAIFLSSFKNTLENPFELLL